MRTYKIVKDGQGSDGFLCPPGHWNHQYALHEYNGPRGRTVRGITGIQYALTEEADAAESVKSTVRRIMAAATLVCSEMYVRSVYGYFRHMYALESGSRDASDAVSDRTNSLPAERHLAVLCVREYFPEHAARVDLIEDAGHGYGSYPCVKCGERVQYEARIDALARVTSGHRWSYDPVCPADGGKHVN
jgi:hypothetical protein